jgi:hypothetical protein
MVDYTESAGVQRGSAYHAVIRVLERAAPTWRQTQFVVYPDEGHFFFKRADQLGVMSRLVDWFETYLKPGPAE